MSKCARCKVQVFEAVDKLPTQSFSVLLHRRAAETCVTLLMLTFVILQKRKIGIAVEVVLPRLLRERLPPSLRLEVEVELLLLLLLLASTWPLPLELPIGNGSHEAGEG